MVPNLILAKKNYICTPVARMVKLVDTLVSGASAHKLAGSSPVPGTKRFFF